MSDPAPMDRFGTHASDVDAADGPDEAHVVTRTLKRARVLIVLVPLVVGLLVAASIGAGKLFEDVPERGAVAPEVTCWNGTRSTAADCPEPRGRSGLRWVFPSFNPGDSRCAQVSGPKRAGGRPVQFACALQYDQRPVTITYAAHAEPERDLRSLERSYGFPPEPEADGARLAFRSDQPQDGLYRVTIAYADHPFSVTVQAPEPGLRDTALDELVRFRPAPQVLVRR
jgi:hypothetical protein